MAINLSNAGVQKARSQTAGILYHAPAGTDISAITDALVPLPEAFVDAGALTTDALTLAENSEEPEVFLDWHGNQVDSSEATSAPSFTFALLELTSENAVKLIYGDAVITTDDEGNVKSILGTQNPTDKILVIQTRIKNKAVRVVLGHTSFSSRGDQTWDNASLASRELTYNVLTPVSGVNVAQYFDEIPAA